MASSSFRDQVVQRLNQCAPVSSRAMFGGYGLYLEGVMFALIAYDVLYFKVDNENRADCEVFGSGPFVYEGKNKPMKMSYYQIPDAIYDDTEQLIQWIEKSHAAARRGKQKMRKKRSP